MLHNVFPPARQFSAQRPLSLPPLCLARLVSCRSVLKEELKALLLLVSPPGYRPAYKAVMYDLNASYTEPLLA